MTEKSKMYEIDGKRLPTWNPLVGCRFECSYCYARSIAKRQKQRCAQCYDFEPHLHIDRLNRKFSKGQIVFVCLMGDISFATFNEFGSILNSISQQPEVTFYIQSKDPIYFYEYLEFHPEIKTDNIVFGTTIETNRDTKPGYSFAPNPFIRYSAIKLLKCRKYVTIEPIMDFDMSVMITGIRNIAPEFVYVGYNTRDTAKKHLPEPSRAKTEALMENLDEFTEVRTKDIREAWYE